MKKISKLLLALLMMFCICACSNEKEKNELTSLYDQGYEPTHTSYQDNKWFAIYQKDFSMENAYRVELEMDQETSDKLFEIDRFEEEGEKQFREIVTTLDNCKITSMNDQLPGEGEFDKYIGKTIQDLENDGYERSGNTYAEEGCVFYLDGPIYALEVTTNEVITFETMDDYSENDIRALTIKQIKLSGFSYKIFN